jgi:thiomorpholine-carboxylate dehydrogenase
MGNGVQAYSHIKALAEVTQYEELRLWSRNEARGKALAEKVGATYFADARQAVSDADIVACTTAAKEPIVKGAWLKAGAFVTAVGWNTIDGRELDDAAMANAVIVESYDAARDQAGNIRGSGCDIFAEIGEIYAGTKIVPKGSTVIYDSVGIAIMGVAAAKLAYDLVIE